MTILEVIQEPLGLAFMQRALLASLMVGAISGIVGSFVVIRNMSFFGDALAHSILPGVAAAYIYTGGAAASIPVIGAIADESVRLFLGGLVAGVGSALFIGWLTRDKRVSEDTAIGIVFVAMFALGIAIISSDPRAYGRDLVHILFGNILGIDDADLILMAACGGVVLLLVILFFKELTIVSFDPALGRTLKLPSEGLRLLLLVLIAVTIVASLQIVGITLMLAMLVVPAATAQLFSRRMHYMMLNAAILGMVGGVVGVYLSYYLEIATSPAIVLTVTAIFGIVLVFMRVREQVLRLA